MLEEAKQLEIAKEFLQLVAALESIYEVPPRPLFKSLLSRFGIFLRHFILSVSETDRQEEDEDEEEEGQRRVMKRGQRRRQSLRRR